MKKLYFYTMMLMLAGFTMTSCETDEEIARRLTGVNWEGNLNTYYSNRWGEEYLDGEYHTVWRFEANNYDRYGAATSGYGYEADYDLNNRYNRAYSPFRWRVSGGDIIIEYDDPTWNPVRIDYYDYKRWNEPIVRKSIADGGSFHTAFAITIKPEDGNHWTYVIPQNETQYNHAL